MQTAYVIKADGEAVRRETCAGTNTGTWRRSAKQPDGERGRKKNPTFFRQFTDTAVISQQSRSTEPQTAQSVSREPNKQFCQALKIKAIKGGGPVVPLPPGCFHSTAQNSSQKPRTPRRTENTSSRFSLPFIGAFFCICTCL